MVLTIPLIKYILIKGYNERKMFMKLLVVGSREIKDFDLCGLIPLGVELIISGGANGIDRLAEKYADENKIPKLIIRPQYESYGRAAPIKRNEEMVRLCDELLVIWDGVSRGTKYTMDYAKKLGKKMRVITVK